MMKIRVIERQKAANVKNNEIRVKMDEQGVREDILFYTIR